MNIIKLFFITFLIIFTFSCSVNHKSGFVGKINNHKIKNQTFLNSVHSKYQTFLLKNNRPPNEKEMEKIRKEVWDNLVQNYVLKDLYKEYDITVSEEEVIDSLSKNVPDVISSSPIFNENDVFKKDIYIESLMNNSPVDLSWLKKNYRKWYLPTKKLKNKIIKKIKITEEEIKKEFNIRNSKANAKLVFFDPQKIDDLKVKFSNIVDYYEKNKSKYRINPSSDIVLAFHKIRPTKLDTMRAKTLIDSVYDKLENGQNFVYLVNRYSDSKTAMDQGIKGYVFKDSLNKELSSKLSDLETGDFSKPIKIGSNWVIYQVIKETKNLIKLREIVIKPEVTDKTISEYHDRIIKVRNLAKEIGLKQAAIEHDLDYFEIDSLTYGEELPLLGKNRLLIKRILNSEEKEIYEPIMFEKKNIEYLIQVLKINPGGYKKFNQVKQQIKKSLKKEKQFKIASKKAESFYENHKKPEKLLAKAEKFKWQIINIPYLSYNQKINDEANNKLNRQILKKAPENKIINPIKTKKGIYLPVVLNYYLPRNDINSRDYEIIKKDLIKRKKQSFFENWLKQKINEAEVKLWQNELVI